ncbi:hypothetical protein [Amantichitinum ursilacus]|uniref:DUF2330 domain-containing protein n=1 Tax=Amantichitinum ursilacus TaxID=857265 RepID=A0A0N0XFS5_9NEIS|nr:hypothetical protein [Amantichitinum ursilacus]KPC49362.1 hypothetical protein WG78_20745 [Amantichitinum ursilacus]
MRLNRFVAAAAFLASPFLTTSAIAEDASEVASASVTGMHDAGLILYSKVDELRQALLEDADKHDKVRVMFRVVSAANQQPMPDVKINLWTEDAVYPVPLKNNFLALDDIPRTNDPEAQFSSNKKKGALEFDLYLFAVLPDTQRFSAADALAAIDQANAIRTAVVPWYFRVFIPRFERLEACSTTPPVYTLDGQSWAAAPSVEAGCVSITSAALKAHPQAQFASANTVSSYRLRGPGADD